MKREPDLARWKVTEEQAKAVTEAARRRLPKRKFGELSEDAVQNAWLDYLRYVDDNNQVASLEAFIIDISRKRAVDLVREQARSRAGTPARTIKNDALGLGADVEGAPEPIEKRDEALQTHSPASENDESVQGLTGAISSLPTGHDATEGGRFLWSTDINSANEDQGGGSPVGHPCVALILTELEVVDGERERPGFGFGAYLRLVTGISAEMIRGDGKPPPLRLGGVQLLMRLVFGRRLFEQAQTTDHPEHVPGLWRKMLDAVALSTPTERRVALITAIYQENSASIGAAGIVPREGADPQQIATERYACATSNVLDRLYGDAKSRKRRLLHKQIRFFYGAARYLAWKNNPDGEIDMDHAVRQKRAEFSAKLRSICERHCEAGMCGSISGAIEAV